MFKPNLVGGDVLDAPRVFGLCQPLFCKMSNRSIQVLLQRRRWIALLRDRGYTICFYQKQIVKARQMRRSLYNKSILYGDLLIRLGFKYYSRATFPAGEGFKLNRSLGFYE